MVKGGFFFAVLVALSVSHAHKTFEGTLYTFGHLVPLTIDVPIQQAPGNIPLFITFSHHCFTEDFDATKHNDGHRYTFTDPRTQKTDERAFDVVRHECSLQLPEVVKQLVNGRIYRSQDKYTYVAQISLESAGGGLQPYSIFFKLEADPERPAPAARMYVASAYLKALASSPNAQAWRFKQLVGEISGAFAPKAKKAKPTKRR